MASFDWSNHDTILMAIKPMWSTDDSAGFSSSSSPENNSSQDFLMNNFGGDYFNDSMEQVNGNNYRLQQQPVNSIEGLLIPLDSASYSLLHTLFDTDESDNNLHPMNHNYSNYDQINIPNDLLPSNNDLAFTNYEPDTWTSMIDANFIPSTQSQSFGDNKKRNFQNALVKSKNEGAKKFGAIKRARIQTPSPLPTFKVRKEKMGDRVTALQQLVSPFGKTDTASVLHEATEYIKYLHDQIGVFSGPYLKNKSTPLQHLQTDDKVKQDLQTRGLCLVPISSTFPITETTTDFWTPIFGDGFV